MAGREDLFQKEMSTGHSAAWDQQWDKAAVSYRKALEEFPEQPKALTSLGLALFELQRNEESLQVYQKAAQVAPDDPIPLEKVGQLSERVGRIPDAIQSFLKAAELYIRNQETDKAIENWVRVTQLDPGHITAHSYLAMVHERLGHVKMAIAGYLAVAGLLQRSGKVDKAAEMIGRALRLNPRSPEARQAQTMLKGGQLLPRPILPQGGTTPQSVAQVKQLKVPTSTDTGLDPIAEARNNALTRMAEVLFELSEDTSSPQESKRGMQVLVRGSGELNLKENDRAKVLLHLGLAIDAQTKVQEAHAADELEKALSGGLTDPALYFDLGYLRSKSERVESAMRYLQTAVKNEAYALGARLLLAEIQHQLGRLPDAVAEYMAALKTADSMVVPPEQADEMRQLYEPLIEATAHQTDPDVMERLCENIKKLLLRPNWRAEVLKAREQLPKSEEGTPPLPLAEILAQAQSSQVIETMGKIRALASTGHLRSAMDEAFESLRYAPTYLPIHTLIGDLLIQEGRTQDAIAKYTVVAEAYSVRGEATQAVNLLRRIIQVAPMDLGVRTRLIDQLASRGMVDEAVGEYMDMADIYYRLAELEMARKTYTTALRLAQQGGANRAWSVKLMRRMADIDMQRLDWRQAMRIFEQLRTLEPDDGTVRNSLIDLNIRLNQPPQAAAELASYMEQLQSTGKRGEAIPFLEDLIKEHSQQAFLRHTLAEEYRRAGRAPNAVAQLDALGDILLKAGDRNGAIQAMEAIVAMNPPNLHAYQTLLTKLKSEG
jgi:tetratricopeptide (TPR) repeat protein